MSVLLTDEAVRATAGADIALGSDARGYWVLAEDAANQFVHYHATEGREALVERVEMVAVDFGADETSRRIAEAIVTALFGECPSPGETDWGEMLERERRKREYVGPILGGAEIPISCKSCSLPFPCGRRPECADVDTSNPDFGV